MIIDEMLNDYNLNCKVNYNNESPQYKPIDKSISINYDTPDHFVTHEVGHAIQDNTGGLRIRTIMSNKLIHIISKYPFVFVLYFVDIWFLYVAILFMVYMVIYYVVCYRLEKEASEIAYYWMEINNYIGDDSFDDLYGGLLKNYRPKKRIMADFIKLTGKGIFYG